jgi:thioredoxin 1
MNLDAREVGSLRPWYRRRKAIVAIAGVVAVMWLIAPHLTISDSVLVAVDDVQAEALIDLDGRPVVIEFVVPGCHFCKGASRLLRQVAADTGDSVRYAQIDLSEHTLLADRFAIQAVPTILVFRDRTLLGRTSIIESKAALDKLLARP